MGLNCVNCQVVSLTVLCGELLAGHDSGEVQELSGHLLQEVRRDAGTLVRWYAGLGLGQTDRGDMIVRADTECVIIDITTVYGKVGNLISMSSRSGCCLHCSS